MSPTTFPPPAIPEAQVFGDPQLHTDGDLVALAFTSDGFLLSVEEPGVLRRWNAENGKQVEWHSLSDLETQWCFSTDGRLLASASNDLTLWDTSSGQVLTAMAQPSWVTALGFAPDSSFLATGHDDGSVRYWDAAGHQTIQEVRLHKGPVSAVAVSPDGKYLASAGEDKVIGLWSLSDGKLVGKLVGHTDRIPALTWHPHCQHLISAGWDTTARVWDIRTLQPAILLNSHSDQVTALAASRDGQWLATADSALSVQIWKVAGMKVAHVLRGPRTEIRSLAFSYDGKRLAATGDRMIHLWDSLTGQAIASAGAHNLADCSVSISPDGNHLASNGGGSSCVIWNVATRKSEQTLAAKDVVHAVAYSPNGRLIAGAASSRIHLWDAKTGEIKLNLDGPTDAVTCLAFSPDSRTLASGSSGGIGVWLWRVTDGEPILLIPDALDGCTIEAVAFHPDGRLLAVGGIDWLATGGSDGAVCLWDTVERCEVATMLGGSRAIALHPWGKHLASAGLEQAICIWDLQTREIANELVGHDGPVNAVAYSPDGRWLASGSDDRILRLWDDAGDEIGALELDSQIKSLCVSPDGKFIYTGNGNTTCYQVEVQRILVP